MTASRRTVYLVRHGEAAASWGQSRDPGLSELGHEQARGTSSRLIEVLGGTGPTLISSPLARARETAAPLAEALSLEVTIDERVCEIPSPAPLAGRQEWLRAFMRERWSEQGAALHQWRCRILEALAELPDRAVVFSHFLVLNTIVGAQEERDETLVFWPANASVTVLRENAAGRWDVEPGEQMHSIVN
jgi:probable phosphoglycerate mutase